MKRSLGGEGRGLKDRGIKIEKRPADGGALLIYSKEIISGSVDRILAENYNKIT